MAVLVASRISKISVANLGRNSGDRIEHDAGDHPSRGQGRFGGLLHGILLDLVAAQGHLDGPSYAAIVVDSAFSDPLCDAGAAAGFAAHLR